jgi:hypothetical protein
VPLEPPDTPEAPEPPLVLPGPPAVDAELVELAPVVFPPLVDVVLPPVVVPPVLLPCANTELVTIVDAANAAMTATKAIKFNFDLDIKIYFI